jgi:hypothetical protein
MFVAILGDRRSTLPANWTTETAIAIAAEAAFDAAAGAGPGASLTLWVSPVIWCCAFLSARATLNTCTFHRVGRVGVDVLLWTAAATVAKAPQGGGGPSQLMGWEGGKAVFKCR